MLWNQNGEWNIKVYVYNMYVVTSAVMTLLGHLDTQNVLLGHVLVHSRHDTPFVQCDILNIMQRAHTLD